MTIKYDFLYSYSKPEGIGSNIYLLGTSEDGPLYEPVLVKNKEQARKIFGDENKGTLVKAFDQAYDSGKDISIFLMRITGKSATFELVDIHPESGELESILHIRSIFAGEKYNNIHFMIDVDEETDSVFFEIHTKDGIHLYELEEGMTLDSLLRGVNDDCRNGKHPVIMSSDYPDIPLYQILHRLHGIYLQGGEDGINATRDDLYINAEVAYEILLGRPIDIIVPVDMYVDDVNPAYLYGKAVYGSAFYASGRDYLQLVDTYNNDKVVTYHEQLIDFCRQQVSLGYMTHGVIGFRPLPMIPRNIESNDSYILRIIETTAFRDRTGFVEYRNGYWVDKGFYISVVCSELIFNKGTPNEYYANGAVRYGALLAGQFDTTTNMPIGNDVELRYELSESTRGDLSHLGIVSFRNSIRSGLVVHSGVTAAIAQNDYHSIANTRMTQLTIAYMNEAVQLVYESDFVAEIRRMFLEELIKERLSLLHEAGVILKYNYDIRFLSDDSLGEIILQLQTKYTIDGIVTIAQIKPGVS